MKNLLVSELIEKLKQVNGEYDVYIHNNDLFLMNDHGMLFHPFDVNDGGRNHTTHPHKRDYHEN